MAIAKKNGYFEVLWPSYLLEGIRKLENRWTEYVELKSDYEKQDKFYTYHIVPVQIEKQLFTKICRNDLG